MHKVSVVNLMHADILDYVYYARMLCSCRGRAILFSIPLLQEEGYCLPLTNNTSSKLHSCVFVMILHVP